MELAQAKERVNPGQLSSRISAAFLLLSQISLGAAIVLAPFRYHWILQARPQPPIYIDYTSFYLYPADLGLLLALACWVLSLLFLPRRISLRPVLLTASLAGVTIITAISSIFSIDRSLSIYNSVRMLALFGLYLYLINEIHSLKVILIPVSLQLFIQSIVGIAQVLRQHSLGLAALKEIPLDPSVKGVSIVWAEGLRSLRAYGLTDHPNLLGGCLAFALLILAVAYLDSHPNWRPIVGGLFALGLLALLVTFSRAAWLGLLVGLMIIGFWLISLRLRVQLIAFAGLSVASLLLLAPFLWANSAYLGSRLNLDGSFNSATPENQSINERSLLANQADQIIARQPIFGTGVGTFPLALQKQAPSYPFDLQPPHAVLWEAAAETGLPAAALYGLAWIAPFILLLVSILRFWGNQVGKPGKNLNIAQGRRRVLPSLLLLPAVPEDLSTMLQLVGLTAALLAVVVVSFLDYYPWLLEPGRIWQWLLWGLWGGVYITVSKRWKHA